jgi:hypothetical protein
MSERKAVGTTATASGAMDAKGGGNKVVERSRLAAKGDAVERVKDKDRNAAGGAGKNPKKRRKVNHGTQYLAFKSSSCFLVNLRRRAGRTRRLACYLFLFFFSTHPQFGQIHVASDL